MNLICFLFVVQPCEIECTENAKTVTTEISPKMDQLKEQITLDELFRAREKYCQAKAATQPEMCSKDDFSEIPESISPEFVALALSLVKVNVSFFRQTPSCISPVYSMGKAGVHGKGCYRHRG